MCGVAIQGPPAQSSLGSGVPSRNGCPRWRRAHRSKSMAGGIIPVRTSLDLVPTRLDLPLAAGASGSKLVRAGITPREAGFPSATRLPASHLPLPETTRPERQAPPRAGQRSSSSNNHLGRKRPPPARGRPRSAPVGAQRTALPHLPARRPGQPPAAIRHRAGCGAAAAAKANPAVWLPGDAELEARPPATRRPGPAGLACHARAAPRHPARYRGPGRDSRPGDSRLGPARKDQHVQHWQTARLVPQ